MRGERVEGEIRRVRELMVVGRSVRQGLKWFGLQGRSLWQGLKWIVLQGCRADVHQDVLVIVGGWLLWEGFQVVWAPGSYLSIGVLCLFLGLYPNLHKKDDGGGKG